MESYISELRTKSQNSDVNATLELLNMLMYCVNKQTEAIKICYDNKYKNLIFTCLAMHHEITETGGKYSYNQGRNYSRDTCVLDLLEFVTKNETNSTILGYAYNMIGIFYDCGYGVKTDEKIAHMYYELSAQRENAVGFLNLATNYKSVNMNLAINYFEKTANLYNPYAIDQLIDIYTTDSKFKHFDKAYYFYKLNPECDIKFVNKLYYLVNDLYSQYKSHCYPIWPLKNWELLDARSDHADIINEFYCFRKQINCILLISKFGLKSEVARVKFLNRYIAMYIISHLARSFFSKGNI